MSSAQFQRASARTAYVRVLADPVYLLFRRLIETAFYDAKLCTLDGPTPEAIEAYEWLMDDSAHPLGFVWCCYALTEDPEVVRAEGLWSTCRPATRQGGMNHVLAAWERAAGTLRMPLENLATTVQ